MNGLSLIAILVLMAAVAAFVVLCLRKENTNMSRGAWSAALTAVAAVIGFFAGAFLNNAFGGAIVFAIIAGVGCIVSAIDDLKEDTAEDEKTEA